MSNVSVRRLTPGDADVFRAVRLAALAEAPDAFGALHAVEARRPASAFVERLATSAVFLAEASSGPAGMLGLAPRQGAKDRHKAFLWGMFVCPQARGRGVGAALLQAALDAAAPPLEQVMLSVVVGNDAAIRLYQRFGFQTYGVEPRALKDETGYRDELLMIRLLGSGWVMNS